MICMTDDPKKAGVPPFLQVQNRRPPTAAEQAAVDAFFSRPAGAVASSVKTEADARAAAEIAAALKREKEEAFMKRLGRAKARSGREGRWVPGCRWDAARGRWIHPAARWDAALGQWIQTSGAAAEAAPRTGETSVAKEKKQKKAPGEGRDVKRPCGLVSEFGQVREGTARATVVKMGLKGCTVESLANAIGKDRATVMTHLFCLNRDCAIGYEVAGGRLSITLPGSKTLEDAIKPAAEAA